MSLTDKLLNTSQVAKVLGYSIAHTRRLCSTGVIRAEKVGTDWLVKEANLKHVKRNPNLKKPVKNGLNFVE